MKKLTLIASIIIATSTFAQIPTYVPTNGIVGWWPFNGNANDESGNNHNLNTIGDAQSCSNRFNNLNSAYYLSTVLNNSRLEFNQNDFNIIDNFTQGSISFWVNIISNDISNHYFGFDNMFVVRQKHGQNTQLFIGLKGGTTQLRLHLNGALPSSGDLESIQALNLNEWYHVTYTWNGQYEKVYINGQIDNSINSTNSITSISNPDMFCFGSYSGVGSPTTNSELDDIGIWNRALTACEIKNLYNGEVPNSSQTQTALDTYTWPVNNQTYTQSGTYSDTLVNAAGCDSIVTLNLTLNYTGINENNSSLLVISPNPTTGSFSLHGLEQLGTITSLRIMDNNGKVVQVLDPKATQFACSTLKTGVYFLEVTGVKTNDIVKLVIQ